MCKKGYYTDGVYWGYNPETGKYDMQFESEEDYEEWYDTYCGEDED